MEKIDLSKLSYKELTDLEVKIAKEKSEEFHDIRYLRIVNNHLCYGIDLTCGAFSHTAARIQRCDVFTDEPIATLYEPYGRSKGKSDFTSCLEAHNIDYKDITYLRKEELLTLWEPIETELLLNDCDNEEAMLREKLESVTAKKAGLKAKTKKLSMSTNMQNYVK